MQTRFLELLLIFLLISPSLSLRVAIVGSGFSGSSAAYFLANLTASSGIEVDTVVFEKEDRTSGRVNDIKFAGVRTELGADVCHTLNKWCLAFTDQFNLTSTLRGTKGDPRSQSINVEAKDDDSAKGLGMWNGKEFVFLSSQSNYMLVNLFHLWYRYGLDMITIQKDLDQASSRWQQLYEEATDGGPWRSIPQFLDRLSLSSYLNKTLEEYLIEAGYSPVTIGELISGITLVIYQQKASEIHSLAGLISLAASTNAADLFEVVEGNKLIATRLLEASKATVKLNTMVSSIEYLQQQNKYKINLADGTEEIFDKVILSTPLEITDLELKGIPKPTSTSRKYVKMFVTLVEGTLNPSYFGYEKKSQVPPRVMVTANADSPFTVISMRQKETNGSTLYKFFSKEREMTDKELNEIFSVISQKYVKEWYAYPYFPAVKDISAGFPPLEFTPGFYYPPAFESVATTMECSMISSRNVVRMLLEDIKIKQEQPHQTDLPHTEL